MSEPVRPPYLPPMVYDLSGPGSSGDSLLGVCESGTAPWADCSQGFAFSPENRCATGSSPFSSGCTPGGTPTGSECFPTGSDAGNTCNTGVYA